MNKKFYKLQADFLTIGSIGGSKKDVIAFIEGQIEKYSYVPNNCKYFIKKGKDGIFHFEIQENPRSGSILSQIIKDLETNKEDEALGNSGGEEEDSSINDIYIYDNNDVQYQIYKRKDGTLRTFIRNHDEVVLPPIDGIETFKGSGIGFVAYFSKLAVAKYVSGFLFGVTLCMAIFAGSLWLTQDMVQKGYVNAAKSSPVSVVLKANSIFDLQVQDSAQLPIIGGLDQIRKLDGQEIRKLIYNGASWAAIPNQKAKKAVSDE